ncbi:MAG: hypothetical protein M9962_15370 [Oligoflexia bacterium]|nr:hypothetical protein [Oligoflexia bacterium]
MNLSLFLLVSIKFALAAFPNDYVPSFGEGSVLSLTLPLEVIEKRKVEWQSGSIDDGLRCSISIYSHYDQEKIRAQPRASYEVLQNNNQNSFSMRGGAGTEWREQVTFKLSSNDKNYPILLLDCFKIHREEKSRYSFTLPEVNRLMSGVNLKFEKEVKPQGKVLRGYDIVKDNLSITAATEIAFNGVYRDDFVRWVDFWGFTNGRRMSQSGKAKCVLEPEIFRSGREGEKVEVLIPKDAKLNFRYVTSLFKTDGFQLIHVTFEIENTQITFRCYSDRSEYFREGHLSKHLENFFIFQ